MSLVRMERSKFFSFLSLFLALTYFCFQAELFEDEYEANHPTQTTQRTVTISKTPASQESDKENAQEAFVAVPVFYRELLNTIPVDIGSVIPAHPISLTIRDKSPPFPFSI